MICFFQLYCSFTPFAVYRLREADRAEGNSARVRRMTLGPQGKQGTQEKARAHNYLKRVPWPQKVCTLATAFTGVATTLLSEALLRLMQIRCAHKGKEESVRHDVYRFLCIDFIVGLLELPIQQECRSYSLSDGNYAAASHAVPW